MSEITNVPNIAAAAEVVVAPAKKMSPAGMMKSIVNNKASMEILQSALKDNAGAFAASVIDLYGNDTYLQQCDPRKVFQECLKAVSLKLPINKQLGFAWVIPFRDGRSGEMLPQFQLGYKGIIQLCMRTGAYKYINCDCVYEGEEVVVDRVRGSVEIKGEPATNNVIGYFAYLETTNGFSKAYYWSRERVIAHAEKFSKSYKQKSSAWHTGSFDAMAQKTVLSNLLHKWGLMSTEFISSAEQEEMAALADDTIIMGDEEA